jgi:histone acetyltransferase MYST2
LYIKATTKEQTEYFKIVDEQLKTLVKSPNSQTTKHSFLHELARPELMNDIKSLTTSFIIQSISANIAPSHLTNALLKPNALINTLTGLNKTSHVPPIDDLAVSQFDLDLFKDILVACAAEKTTTPQPSTTVVVNTQPTLKLLNKNNKLIQFGNYEIETWYKSPYPDDVWQLGKIFLCQYCLNYMKSHTVLDRHLEKCAWRHPPGREIYRKEKFSFFEVDGKYNKVYCQNLCLLAKLFLDHKTLYYDVEPFLFYVLTQYSEATGSFQMIGYFSKEKQSAMNYNLSCILILPPYMNKSYGRLLIDFSYLLSRVEEKLGSPEKPLSDLGLISYRSYWKAKLMNYLARREEDCEISIKEISLETGILTNDIISTFQYIGLIKYWKGKHIILKDKVCY